MYSINQALSEGADIINEGVVYVLKFKDYNIRFDYQLKTKKGHVMCAILYPTGKYDKIIKGVERRQNINDVHRCLNHRGKGDLERTAGKMNLKLTGELSPCVNCAHARIKRKKIRKDFIDHFEKPGERIAKGVRQQVLEVAS